MAQTLASTAPDVVFLAEVHGTISEMNRGLRTWARRLGYVARFLPGEGGSGREVDSGSHANGMVVLGRMDAGAFASGDRKATLRVEERVFGVQWIAKADGRCRRIAAVHGLHGEGDCSFSVQLQAAFDWLEEDGGGLLVGDLNRVPCKNWRSSGRLLDEDDVALRGWTGWTCACCKVSVPAAVAQRGQVVEWYSARQCARPAHSL